MHVFLVLPISLNHLCLLGWVDFCSLNKFLSVLMLLIYICTSLIITYHIVWKTNVDPQWCSFILVTVVVYLPRYFLLWCRLIATNANDCKYTWMKLFSVIGANSILTDRNRVRLKLLNTSVHYDDIQWIVHDALKVNYPFKVYQAHIDIPVPLNASCHQTLLQFLAHTWFQVHITNLG